MPEGPEVKRIGIGLAKAVSGKTLIEANLVSGKYTKTSQFNPVTSFESSFNF